MSDLIVSKNKKIATLTLNRPEMSNAISMEIIEGIEKKLREFERDDSVRVVILTGAGKYFCAGGDLLAMDEKTGMFAGGPDELRKNYEKGIQRIPRIIESFHKPLIAAINGAAIGAGCDLACMCDLRIAEEKSKFGETFNKLSLVPGDGGTFFLSRIVGYAKAMEMFLTGDIYSAEEALKMGLINKVVDSNQLETEALNLANKISENPPSAVEMTKRSLKMSQRGDLESALSLLSAYQGIVQNSPEHSERVKKLLKN